MVNLTSSKASNIYIKKVLNKKLYRTFNLSFKQIETIDTLPCKKFKLAKPLSII